MGNNVLLTRVRDSPPLVSATAAASSTEIYRLSGGYLYSGSRKMSDRHLQEDSGPGNGLRGGLGIRSLSDSHSTSAWVCRTQGPPLLRANYLTFSLSRPFFMPLQHMLGLPSCTRRVSFLHNAEAIYFVGEDPRKKGILTAYDMQCRGDLRHAVYTGNPSNSLPKGSDGQRVKDQMPGWNDKTQLAVRKCIPPTLWKKRGHSFR